MTSKRSEDSGRGWYLYGVVRSPATDAKPLEVPDADSVELMREGRVAAVVRPVSVRDFMPGAIEERFRDKLWLERAVRAHNAVIEGIHRGRAMLPAKFGAVYARVEDVAAALHSEQDRLLDALERVDGCDEWIVHLNVETRALAETVRRAVAPAGTERRPGHAYFQQKRQEREREETMELARSELAATGYDALARHADDGRTLPSPQLTSAAEEIEVLRAAFLVPRGDADRFLASMQEFAARHPGSRWEYSGPLPPYSFASANEEEAA